MSDPRDERDPLMKGLGDVVREERAPRDDDQAKALLAPFDASELDALTERAASALGAGEVDAIARATTTTKAGGAPMTSARERARARWAWVATPLAAAAMIALFIAKPWSSTGVGLGPDYELVAEGDARATRSDPAPATAAPMRIERGGAITLYLRPRSPGTGAIGVRAFLDHEGALSEWAVAPKISEEKAVRIDVDAAMVEKLPAGPSRIVIFVGAPDVLPADATRARDAMTRPTGARVLFQDIVVAR